MSNEFFTATGVPGSHAAGLSSEIRGELLAVEQGFNKLPVLAGNAGKVVVVNPSETGLLSDPNNLIRESDIDQGDNIVVTVSGSQFIQNTGSYFIVTSAGGFDVTGFNTTNIMKIFTLLLPGGLNLVDSATFRLRDRMSRRSIPGEILRLVNDITTGAFIELGEAKLIDMTGYSGADISLGIGQTAIYDVTAATSIPLRIATANNQLYELSIMPTYASSATIGVNCSLLQNNAVLAAANILLQTHYGNGASSLATSTTTTTYNLGFTYSLLGVEADISTKTVSKRVFSRNMSRSDTASYAGISHSINSETTVAWTSLGTITCNAITGRVAVRRVM